MLDKRDILETGLRMEQDAHRYYSDAADRVDHPGAKQMLRELAAEEKYHAELFTRAVTGEEVEFGKGLPDQVPDLKIGETLTTPRMSDSVDPAEILIIGIKAEMKAIAVYKVWAEACEGTYLEKLLLSIAREEQMHKYRLEKIYDDEYLSEN